MYCNVMHGVRERGKGKLRQETIPKDDKNSNEPLGDGKSPEIGHKNRKLLKR